MRHLRMVGLGLVAVLVMSAIGAGSALAKKSHYSAHTLAQYKYCDYEDEENLFCYAGITSGGSNGGFFKLGDVTVKLNKPITLQGGIRFSEGGEFPEYVTPATHGGETLESPYLRVQRGLGVFTKQIQEQAEWPEALKQSFKEAKKNHEKEVSVKIETAGGNALYETPEAINTLNLIIESGAAFILPLKVKVKNSWLEKLGGGPCTIGNEVFPIYQHLTTEGAGKAGVIEFDEEFENIALTNSTLVDTSWPVPEGAKASGCGGEYEKYVDDALNIALNIHPGKTGITVLTGDLFVSPRENVQEAAEKGEL